ncbi:MAG: YaeQ family protein, partial [Herbaspirillum sp.]
ADMDRHYYHDHFLTLARHPSETDERMMMRLLAFVRYADAALTFGKGLADVEEPDLWRKDLTGAIDLWLEVGQPDARRILKACGRAAQVVVLGYGSQSALWWAQVGPKLARAKNLTVWSVPVVTTQALASLAQRSMQLQCSIEDGLIWLRSEDQAVQIELTTLMGAANSTAR